MKIRHHFADGGYEDHILPRAIENIENYFRQYTNEWNDIHDPDTQIVKSEVIDSFLHEHEWIRTINGQKTGGNDHFQCVTCMITGHAAHSPNASRHIQRDKLYWDDKYEYCHEPKRKLKPFN